MKLSKFERKISEILSMKQFLKFISFNNKFIYNSNKFYFLISRQSIVSNLDLLSGLEKVKEPPESIRKIAIQFSSGEKIFPMINFFHLMNTYVQEASSTMQNVLGGKVGGMFFFRQL